MSRDFTTKMYLSMGIMTIALAGACQSKNSSESDTKIIGGRLTDNHEFFASIILNGAGDKSCGASFISKNYVISAAHCFQENEGRLKVRIGHFNNEPEKYALLDVEAIINHENFSMEKLHDDIALLKIADYDETTLPVKISPIQLNTDTSFPHIGKTVSVIGYGNTSSFGVLYEDKIRRLDPPVVSLDLCKKAYGEGKIFDTNICAGYMEGGKDSCQGDSGGPLFTKDANGTKLVGIVSWGQGCAQPNFPGVYTKVSDYIPWIEEAKKKLDEPTLPIDANKIAELQSYYCYNNIFENSVIENTDNGGLNVASKTTFTRSSEFIQKNEVKRNATPKNICKIRTKNGVSIDLDLEHASATSKAFNFAKMKDEIFVADVNHETKSEHISCTISSPNQKNFMYFGDSKYGYFHHKDLFFMFNLGEKYKGHFDRTKAVTIDSCLIKSNNILIHKLNDKRYVEFDGVSFGHRNQGIYELVESASTSVVEKDRVLAMIIGEYEDMELMLLNKTKEAIYTWKMSCNMPYKLTDRRTNKKYLSRKTQEETAFKPALYTIHIEHPKDPNGKIDINGIKQFNLKLVYSLPSKPICNINGEEIEVIRSTR